MTTGPRERRTGLTVELRGVGAHTEQAPSPGGQVSGISRNPATSQPGVVARVRHPLDLPKGYHTPPRGQA
jgi:hypothetical protein